VGKTLSEFKKSARDIIDEEEAPKEEKKTEQL